MPACAMIAAGSKRSSRSLARCTDLFHRARDRQTHLRVGLQRFVERGGDPPPLVAVDDVERPGVLDLARFGPAGLVVALASGSEAQPVEGLVLSDLDLSGDATLRAPLANVPKER